MTTNYLNLTADQHDAAERHNAYGWIKPDATACHICQRRAFATPVEEFVVRECDNCDRPVCELCAEIDLTQWQCKTDCACVALIKSQLCVECHKPTSGSIGQAGYFWRFLCQPCKDFADGYLRATVQAQATIMKAVDRIVEAMRVA